jgi:two-component system CheB/CheR fusion protein
VARAIRQKRNGAPYLIAITGFGQQEDQHRAFEAGFDLHLVKPVDLAALKEALCKLSK